MAGRICPLRNTECTEECAWHDKSTGNQYSACSVIVIKHRLYFIEEFLKKLPKIIKEQ